LRGVHVRLDPVHSADGHGLCHGDTAAKKADG
jgi:hypothetical protein